VSFGVRRRGKTAAEMRKLWSWRRELNPRPSDYKSDALPTELRQRLEMERGTGIEPATNSVEGCDSTVELPPPPT
jgi:hypothetical protein